MKWKYWLLQSTFIRSFAPPCVPVLLEEAWAIFLTQAQSPFQTFCCCINFRRTLHQPTLSRGLLLFWSMWMRTPILYLGPTLWHYLWHLILHCLKQNSPWDLTLIYPQSKAAILQILQMYALAKWHISLCSFRFLPFVNQISYKTFKSKAFSWILILV